MLSIIAGKPGQGKSYHMAMLLVDMLTEWVRYELREGKLFDSSIWTNIVLREEGLNETIGKRLGKKVDAWKYINYCDTTFFNDPECSFWWTKFPPKSVIVIDEVHFHLGKKVEYGSLDMEQALINWISTHRHTQQEIYFLTQHTDQFASQVLGIADKLLEIVNMKSMDLPWPISVPMIDIYDLKSAWGIKTQYYQANIGNFRGKAVRWSGAIQRYMMTPDIFRVYKSHDAGMEESDRPSLNMTKLGSLRWFFGKHGWHLVPKVGGIVAMPFVLAKVLFSLPVFLMTAVSGNFSEISAAVPAVVQEVSAEESPSPPSLDRNIPMARQSASPAIRPAAAPGESSPVAKVESIPAPTRVEPVVVKRLKMVMLFNGGVIFDDGSRVTSGEAFDYEGKTETLAFACAVCGVVGFESGKRLRF